MNRRIGLAIVCAGAYAIFMGCITGPLTEVLRAVPQSGVVLTVGRSRDPALAFAIGTLIVLSAWGYARLMIRSGAMWLCAAVTASSIVTAFLLMAVCAIILQICGAWLEWFYQVHEPAGTCIDLFGREPRYALFWGLFLATVAVLMCLSCTRYLRREIPRFLRRVFVWQLWCAVACGAAAVLIGGLPTAGGYWQYSGAACALAISGTLVGVLSGTALFLFRYRAVSNNDKQSSR